MEWRDEKSRFYQTLVNKGLDRKEISPADCIAPPELLAKWVRSFYAPAEDVRLSDTPRLLNRFSIGADPELIFVDAYKRYVYAESLGMDTLAAFGCDMSGRQAELRAYPSRSALDVVASLMEALRWMAATYPVDVVKWVATPYIEDGDGHRDGCGGHVHFGRKRPGVEDEVMKLDNVNTLLLAANVFDQEANGNRADRTKYGRYTDFRLQRYGYEYRTFSTWADNPWMAFLALVVSKLSVLHRTPLIHYPPKAQQQIKNLLCLYKGLDDDALIAWKAMQVLGMPRWVGGDIRTSWGVLDAPPRLNPKHCYIPSSIAPEPQTRQELFNFFTKGTVIPRRAPNPTWAPFKLPAGFHKVTVQPHVFNIPDLAMGLVSKNIQVHIMHGNRLEFHSPIALPQVQIRKRLQDIAPAAFIGIGHNLTVVVPKGMAEVREQLHSLKTILSDSSLFPICRVEDIDKVEWGKWAKSEVAEKKAGLLGRKVSTICGQEGI